MAAKLFRRCVSCHCVADRATFWRVVRLHRVPDGELQPQLPVNTLPSNTLTNLPKSAVRNSAPLVQLDHGMGRSAYVCQKAPCLQQAQKKNRLSKALRAPIPAAIFTELERRLAEIATHQG